VILYVNTHWSKTKTDSHNGNKSKTKKWQTWANDVLGFKF